MLNRRIIALAAFTLVAGVAGLSPTQAAAEYAPALNSIVLNEDGMGLDQCMERATRAMRRVGGENITTRSPGPDLGWVDGYIGNYSARIDCLTYRGMVVIMVAGPNGETARIYEDQLVRWTDRR